MNVSNSTTGYRLMNAIKVNSISVWGVAIAGLSASVDVSVNNVSLEWLSTYGPSRIITDTTINPAETAMIHSKSPPNSLCGFWSTSNSNESDVMFKITSLSKCIVDVNFTYTIQDDSNVFGQNTTNSGTLGVVYATYLDGPASGAIFQPIGLPFLN
jgi:hypothetical protein